MHADSKHLWACLIGLLAGTHLAACSDLPSDSAADTCSVDERPCEGTNGCQGVQRCVGEPRSWSSCECSDGGTDAGNLDSGRRAVLGATCSENQDCPEGATCLREEGSDYFGGGPPQGTCVAECTGDPDHCEQFADAVCVTTSREGEPPLAHCFPACSLGSGDGATCGERENVACDLLEGTNDEGFCRPFCVHDDDCADAFCDRRVGACVSMASSGEPLGAECALDATEPSCAGLCLDLGDDYAVCSHRCSYGSTELCEIGTGRMGLCAYAAPEGGLGDIGYCAELCDCDDDCTHPGAGCNPFQSDAVRELTGKEGLCAPTGAAGAPSLECLQ